MKLQLSLDIIDIADAKALLKEVINAIDIIEVGTPFIIKEGLRAVEELRKEYPNLLLLADLKIMDAGEYEAKMAFDAGADIITVLGVADDATIKGAVHAAKGCNKFVMVDMIGVKDIEQRAKEIDLMEVDYICVHTAFDVQSQGRNPLSELQIINKVIKCAKIAVAGGIKLNTLEAIVNEKPEIVVVGGGITGQKDRRQATLAMREIIDQGGNL